jgi:hypothetical protein
MVFSMPDPRDIVDIPGLPQPPTPRDRGAGAARPWLGILFVCCGVYSRVYKHPSGRKYVGRCPRCGAPLSVSVGPGGTHQRFFAAS